MSDRQVKTLIIGGPFNGQRVICDPNQPTVTLGAYTKNTGTNFPPFTEFFSTTDTIVQPTFKTITSRYYLIDMGYGFYLGIYEKLTIEEGLALLIDRYPKKRKNKFGSSRKSKFKSKKDWDTHMSIDSYFLKELEKSITNNLKIPMSVLRKGTVSNSGIFTQTGPAIATPVVSQNSPPSP